MTPESKFICLCRNLPDAVIVDSINKLFIAWIWIFTARAQEVMFSHVSVRSQGATLHGQDKEVSPAPWTVKGLPPSRQTTPRAVRLLAVTQEDFFVSD